MLRFAQWKAWWGSSPLGAQVRTSALTVSLVLATAYFLGAVNRHYPIRNWLFFAYVEYWLLTLLFNVACFSSGYVLLRALLRKGLPERERAVLSMAVGVLAFYVGMFLAGLAHLYGTAFFFAWPFLLASVGGRALIRHLRRLRRALKRVRAVPRRGGLLTMAISAFGVIALGIIYLGVMTPENVAFDARWYHLPIAEHYAAVHGVVPFAEGWYQGALPHLTSFLYVWPMLLPGAHVVDRVLVCAHIEFSLFLWTLYGVMVLARRMAPGKPMRLAWTALFLFPGIFVYDGNLSTAADHVAAFWAVPIFLALLRAWPELDMRASILLGALLAGALDTKYQASCLVVFPALALAARALWLCFRPRSTPRFAALGSGVAAAVTLIVLWAPHWLKNLIWYGDPLYPFLHRYFPSHPWTPENDLRLAVMARVHLWRPSGPILGSLLETVRTLWSFSFVPHDWDRLERLPVFGSLFTLFLVALPFLRARGRLWALFLAANVGVFSWYWLSHQDRYLQALVPWFASCTAASIALVWESGLLPRLALGGLVGAQVVWGGDAPFIHAHRMIPVSQLKVAIDRITSGFEHDLGRRTSAFGAFVDIGAALPANAKVLVHEEEAHLGLQRPSVSDLPDWQGGISYGRYRSPAEVDDGLKAMGITHIAMVAGRSKDVDVLPGDIVFFDYVTNFAHKWQTFGDWTVLELPTRRPPDKQYGDVLWLGCSNRYAKGRYAMSDMMLPFVNEVPLAAFPKPRAPVAETDRAAIDAAAKEVDAVAFDTKCQTLQPRQLAADFERVTDRSTLQVWIRRRAAD